MPHPPAGSRLPLSRFPSLDIGSLEEASDLYSRMTAPVHIHGMPSRERFSWRVNHLALGPLTLVANETTSNVWAACEGTEDAHLVSIPLADDSAESRVGREVTRLVRGRTGVIVPPGHASRVVVRSGSQTLQISVPRHAVLDAMRTLTGREPRDVRFQVRLALDAPETRSFSRLLGRLLSDADREGPAFLGHHAERWAEALIFRLLLAQPHALAGLLSAPPKAAEPRYVRRAAEYLDTHLDRQVTMAELTEVTGVSARSLQIGFLKSHGCSPVAFVRARRLERARVLLLTHDDALTVSEVAQRVGLTHLGRFSVHYRERFGESPTHTLARSFGTRSARTDHSPN